MANGALSGKTAVVIGASSGIGLSTANLFAGDRTIKAHELDISDGEAVRLMVEEVGESDGIDVLVVAAGMNFPERRLEQLTAEKWDQMISVNLSAALSTRSGLHYRTCGPHKASSS